jgi:CubicO group peptidase (beta-lactamase class C family)
LNTLIACATFRRRTDRLASLACLSAALLTACSSVPPERNDPVRSGDYQHLARSIDWRVLSEMKRAAVPGVVVAVVDGQRVVYSHAWGVARSGGNTAVDENTCFRIGSISKLFTATALLRLADDGQLQLDDPITAHVPDVRIGSRFPDAAPMTLRALLSHHAGLQGNRLRGMWEQQPSPLAELPALLADEALVWAPQSRYGYSNLGFGLLGSVVELRTGLPFAQALRQNVLLPLGMSQAGFHRNGQVPPGCATGHRAGAPLPPVGLRDESAGAMTASAGDMAQFLKFALADGRGTDGAEVLRPAALQSMFQPQFEGLPLDFGHRIGLAWMLSGQTVRGATGPIAWHAGQFPGYHAAVVVSRADGVAVVVLANAEEASTFTVQVAAEALVLALEAKTGHAAPQRASARPTLKTAVAPAELAALAGDYAVFGSRSRFRAKDGKLSAQLLGNQLDLVPATDGRFVLQKGVLGLVDVTVPDLFVRFATVQGRRYAVLEGLPAPMVFERLQPGPVPAAWTARLGHYSADVGDNAMEFVEFELRVENGLLLARVITNNRVVGLHNAAGSIVLQPDSDSLATVAGGGAMDGGVLQAVRRDGQDVLTYSGYVLTRSARSSEQAALTLSSR